MSSTSSECCRRAPSAFAPHQLGVSECCLVDVRFLSTYVFGSTHYLAITHTQTQTQTPISIVSSMPYECAAIRSVSRRIHVKPWRTARPVERLSLPHWTKHR